MAINVQYGPIASALGLAQVAGAGQGFNQQSQRDLQALQIQNQLQQTINDQANKQAQLVLAQQEMQQKAQEQAQQEQQNSIYREATLNQNQQQNDLRSQQLKQQDAQFQDQQQTRAQQAQAIADQKSQQDAALKAKQDWMKTLSPEEQNVVLSGGTLKTQAQKDAELQAMNDKKDKEAADYVENLRKDRDSMQKQLEKPENLDPAAIPQINDRIKNINATIDQYNAATGSKLGLSQAAPPPASQSIGIPTADLANMVAKAAAQLGTTDHTDPRIIPIVRAAVQAQQQQNAVAPGRDALQRQNLINQSQAPMSQDDIQNFRDQVWQNFADNPPMMN